MVVALSSLFVTLTFLNEAITEHDDIHLRGDGVVYSVWFVSAVRNGACEVGISPPP